MNTITRLLVPFVICFAVGSINAQETEKDSIVNSSKPEKQMEIKKLQESKKDIENEERELLRSDIELINKRLDNGKITAAEAEKLKKDAAKKRAANIENRLQIIDSKIALMERNGVYYKGNDEGDRLIIRIGGDDETSESIIYIGEEDYDKPKKYDRRTVEESVFAIGFNNTLIDGQSLDDSPYKLGGSGFVEWGFSWKTRLLNNSNFLRFKYGLSIQWNKLDIKDNNYFVNNNDIIELQEFPQELDKAKFRATNIVIPLHFEFGPSKKIERDNYFRYSTRRQFKIGLGGYAGLNVWNMQKLKYKDDGNRVKNKQRGGYEVSEFIYGLSGYVGIGDIALYVKYDLNPLFKNQMVDQNNISFGVRFDID
ncbi:hypothetical protein J4050_09860 [Winogradskyella sp. DF17]|uniref:Outer membrane protein beta-barrel domain-containing protein n=1 Tax=Winogradskyella pelagia TaxID=2819984 RepID=A0ABS3T456_9FLAO|nr:hypothetical protein [Winogradskyella sp. DF17]MBO3117054.1 hypothetical protein [Winogradskyella sp. DF17]